MEDLLVELIDLMKQAAPGLWVIAMRQVAVRTVHLGIVTALCTVMAALCGRWAYRLWVPCQESPGDEDCEGYVETFLSLFAVAFAIVALACACVMIGHTMNPEYYAIRVLIQLIEY